MTTAPSKSLQCWRWIFLTAEAVLLVTVLGVGLADRLLGVTCEPDSETLSVALGVLVTLCWLFLLIVSPFFLKTLRGVALAGWIIAFGLLVLGMLTPVV
jgi:hypothetical protein